MLNVVNFSISSATKSVCLRATVVKITSDTVFSVLRFALYVVVHCLPAIQRLSNQKEKLTSMPLHFKYCHKLTNDAGPHKLQLLFYPQLCRLIKIAVEV